MYVDHIGIKCTFVCFNVIILGNIIHMLILYLLLHLSYVLIIIYIYIYFYQINSINHLELFIGHYAKINVLLRYIKVTHLSSRNES